MPAGKARLVFERDSSSEVATGSTIVVSGAGSSTELTTLDGYHASDFLSPRYLTLQADNNLTQERVFTPGYGLTGTDGGAGGTYGLSLHLRSPSGLVADASGLAVADTLAGSGLSMTDKVMTIKLQSPSGLTIDANGLAIDDNVAGNGLTITGKVMAVGTPNAVSSTSTNTTTADSHTHAATAYDDSSVYPGHLLKSDASGYLKLVRLTATDRLRTSLIDSETGTNLKLAPAQDLDLQPGGTARVRTLSGVRLQSDNFASQTTGWAVAYSGAADFRYIYTDELHAKAFIADLEQALAGGQIISKSVAPLSRDFTAPAAGADAYLWVECFAGFPEAEVFAAGDYVMVRTFDRSGGGLSITNCFGTVSAPYFPDPQSDPPEQRWTFTRLSGTVNGEPAAGYLEEDAVVKRGALALDFGVSGNGYHEVNAIDGLMAENSPYNQTVKWATHPWYDRTVTTRTGNLKGVFNVADEYGLYAGTGVTDADQFVRISNEAVEAHNLPVKLYDSSNVAIMLQPAASPYMAMGVPIPTGWLSQSGWWAGKDTGVYKQYLGTVSGGDIAAGLKWDGTTLTVKGQIYVTGGDAAKTDLSNVAADTVVGKVNTGATLIQPGRILVSGATTLADWRYGDTTYIDGGDIYTGTVTADKVLVTGQNLVANGGFERSASGTAEGWTALAGYASDANYPRTGTYHWQEPGDFAGPYAARSAYIPVDGGATYWAEAWLKQAGGAGDAGIMVEQYDKTKQWLSNIEIKITVSVNYSRTAAKCTLTGNCSYVCISLYKEDNFGVGSWVWWDDVVFRRMSENLLVVGNPSSARVEINHTGIEGYSDASTKQFYLRTSDGRAMFGGGKGTLDSSGMVLSGNEEQYNTYNGIRWLTQVDPPGGNEVAIVAAGKFISGWQAETGLHILANPGGSLDTAAITLTARAANESRYAEIMSDGNSHGGLMWLRASSVDYGTAFIELNSLETGTLAANWRLGGSRIVMGFDPTADAPTWSLTSDDMILFGDCTVYGDCYTSGGLWASTDHSDSTFLKWGDYTKTTVLSFAWDSTYGDQLHISVPGNTGYTSIAKFTQYGDVLLARNLYLNGYTGRYLYVGGSPAVDLYWYNTKLNRAPGKAGDTGGITVVTGVTVDGTGHVTAVTTRGLTFVDGIVTAVT